MRLALIVTLTAVLLSAGCAQNRTARGTAELTAAAGAHVQAGHAAFNRQNYDAAVREYAAATDAGADTPLIHFRYGYALHMQGRYEEALSHHVAATKITNPALRIDALYNAACANARLGHRREALSYLRKAVDAGFKDAVQVSKDSDLDSLREDREFKRLVGLIEARAAAPSAPA